jgi:hypothetical protein
MARDAALSEAAPMAVPPVAHDVLASPGQPLDASTRTLMESRFGHDFSQVRVHADERAADSAQAVNARAYTVGRDVVFGPHEYAPGSNAGRALLAHELTHVVQQSGSTVLGDGALMREEKPVPPSYNGCTQPQQTQLDTTVTAARRALNTAASVVAGAFGRPNSVTAAHQALLSTHFHTTDRDDMRDILGKYHSIARAFDSGLKLQCESSCPKTATSVTCGYAYNTQWFGGFGPVHICFDAAGCNFSTTAAVNRVALVIHEAAHRHTGVDDKFYRWQPGYATLSAKQAMDNADSYGWFAAQV